MSLSGIQEDACHKRLPGFRLHSSIFDFEPPCSRNAVLIRTSQCFLNLLLNLGQPFCNRFPDQLVIHAKVTLWYHTIGL